MADLKTKKGTKLSKAVVDSLASEAEAGYDLSKAKRERVGPGRPSLTEGEITEDQLPGGPRPVRSRQEEGQG